MKKSNSKNNTLINTYIGITFFLFLLVLGRIMQLGLSTNIDGINIKEFANNRSITKKVLKAKRGSIYDINGNVLAQNVTSYTLIAYLDPTRDTPTKTNHVLDKEKTASSLATVINMEYNEILEILNQENLYQVEFGYAGSGLNELEKEKIEKLNLDGIDFTQTQKRYYPNGDFASYILGYAKTNENGDIVGEFGIEELLNEEGILSGKDGYITYQKDVSGYKIANTNEYKEDVEDGKDIYLTIDTNIQFILEQAINNTSQYDAEWKVLVAADAKTGKILGMAQTPSYNPNKLDISYWYNLGCSSAYEPGSIMKIWTYAAAMENGNYNGDNQFVSGQYVTDDETIIYDWKRTGFGTITYDQGFIASSNVGVINIMNNFIDKNILLNYYKKLGFGKITGITLANEDKGKISFNYQTEIYSAAFGQGITTTPIQHIQALTSLANDGVMLKPYIIEKITTQDNKVLFEGKKEEMGRVASKETTEKIKELMYETVNGNYEYRTGASYALEGYNLIGKTGTSQLVNSETGKYYTSDYYSIKSFVGMWPKDNPEIIIYASVKKPENGSSNSLTTMIKNSVTNISKYLNIYKGHETEDNTKYETDNYIGKKTIDVVNLLKQKNIETLTIGNGDRIKEQYPIKNNVISSADSVILLTNSESYTMPNINKLSKKEVNSICNMLELNCTYEGNGYVEEFSITPGILLNKNDELYIKLND